MDVLERARLRQSLLRVHPHHLGTHGGNRVTGGHDHKITLSIIDLLYGILLKFIVLLWCLEVGVGVGVLILRNGDL